MDVERLARKLKPLRPKEVGHWLRARDLADPELRTLIDRQIIHTAHEVLGDFRQKILLSLPPATLAKGPFRLGTVLYEKEKWPTGLSADELLQGTAIFGRSGAGKTNAVFHILRQLVDRRVPFLFLDWKRTARHLIPEMRGKVNIYTPGRSLSPFPFNPFIPPPGLEAGVYINQVVDVLADAYTLGDGARSILQKAITSCMTGRRTPTIPEVLKRVDEIPGQERVRGWKISATRALESLAFANIAAGDSQEKLVRTLFDQSTIIELDALSQSSKKFLIPLICLWLYSVRLAARQREHLSLVIIVEEAHHVLYRHESSAKETLLEMLLRQCREIGIGMIIVDQHPHLMSSAALGNTYTSLCFNLKDPSDIRRAAGISQVDDAERQCISMLPVGQAIVKLQDRWRRPFLVQIPLVNVPKGFVTDERLARWLSGSITLSGLKRAVMAESARERRPRLGDNGLSPDELTFVEDVIEHPDDGVDARYKRLGISGDKGNRLKLHLVQSGILDAQEIKMGRTRKVLLRVTDAARVQLGLESSFVRHGSIAHEYWKRFYGRLFKRRGYTVQFEAPRYGGRADLIARKNGESVAIEVETGKSDVVSNVRHCLRSRFDRIIIVATNDAALPIVERKLAEAQLIIPTRVQIVLRDSRSWH